MVLFYPCFIFKDVSLVIRGLWVVKKKLGMLGKGFGRKKEKGMAVFQGYMKNKT